MSAIPGTVAIDPAQLEEIVSRVVGAHMPKGPSSFWDSMRYEWSKPSGFIPLATLICGCVIGGITLFNSVDANTKANARQDEYNRQIVEPLIKQVERLEARQTRAEEKASEFALAQKDLTSSWTEWRRGVDVSLESARLTNAEVGRLTGRADSQDQRSSRIFDTLSGSIATIQQQLNDLQRDVAVMNSKLEDGRRSNAPFPLPRRPTILRPERELRPVLRLARAPRLRRVVRSRPIPLLVALFGKPSKVRRSAFLTRAPR